MVMDWSALGRHKGRVALSWSGGKDSTVVLWLLREAGLLDQVTVYHQDTGDLFPEMLEHVSECEAWCPRFVTVRSDARQWALENGDPSDLVPHSSHEIGQLMGEGAGKLSRRYDCCSANLMFPIYARIKADGNTLVIRGTRRSDMKRLPVESGATLDGIEVLCPIQEWTEQDVFDFIAKHDVPIPAFYEHFRQGPECATCPAWWGENRATYLRAKHPALYATYCTRMQNVLREIDEPLANLRQLVVDMTTA